MPLARARTVTPLTPFLHSLLTPLLHSTLTPLFINIYRRAVGKRYAVGFVEGFEVHLLVVADAQTDGDNSPQELTVLARKERRRRQFVPTFLIAQVAHLSDQVVVGLVAKPRFQHVADAKTLALPLKEAPRALQP